MPKKSQVFVQKKSSVLIEKFVLKYGFEKNRGIFWVKYSKKGLTIFT